jgi:hypothetical protein
MAQGSQPNERSCEPVTAHALRWLAEPIGSAAVKHSLQNLAAPWQGRGDARHFSAMARIIVITCYLVDAGYGEACPGAMAEVQEGLSETTAAPSFARIASSIFAKDIGRPVRKP